MDENSNGLYGHHVTNDNPPQQKKLIMTKTQMSDRLEGLVTS